MAGWLTYLLTWKKKSGVEAALFLISVRVGAHFAIPAQIQLCDWVELEGWRGCDVLLSESAIASCPVVKVIVGLW